VLASLVGCSGERPPPVQSGVIDEPIHAGPLTDYLPAAGLDWLLVIEVQRLGGPPFLEEISGRSLPTPWGTLGVELNELATVAVAGYPTGSLWALETRGGEASIEAAFRTEADTGAGDESPHRRVRLMTGLLGGEPARLVSVRGGFVAIALGDPSLARVVALYATNKLPRSPRALSGASFGSLPSGFHREPIRLYRVGPLADPTRGDPILGATTALGISAEPRGDRLRLRIVLLGDWRAEDEAFALAAWARVAASGLGLILGLDAAEDGPTSTRIDDRLEVLATFDKDLLLGGLRMLLVSDIPEIFAEVPERPSKPETSDGSLLDQ
jgi:hypothetical protein